MIWVIGIPLLFISYEAIWWGWTLNRHGTWIQNHPEMDRRKLVSPIMLKLACASSSFLCFFVWMWWLYLATSGSFHLELGHSTFHTVICTILIFSIQLTDIHFSAMLARYSCLPRSMWPLLSAVISYFICRFFKVKIPPLTSCDVHKCWCNGDRRKKERK